MMHINMEKTGKNIQAIFRNNKYSVKDVQSIFNFNGPQAVYKWQRGECLPDIEKLMILSSLFNIPIEGFIIMEE